MGPTSHPPPLSRPRAGLESDPESRSAAIRLGWLGPHAKELPRLYLRRRRSAPTPSSRNPSRPRDLSAAAAPSAAAAVNLALRRPSVDEK